MAEIIEVIQQIKTVASSFFGEVTDQAENEFSFAQGSTVCQVRVWRADPDAPVFIRFRVPLLQEVADSNALHKYVAFHADDYLFGHLSLTLRPAVEDFVDIHFTHAIVGESLSDEEITHTIASIMFSADRLDDELGKRFGGQRYADTLAIDESEVG